MVPSSFRPALLYKRVQLVGICPKKEKYDWAGQILIRIRLILLLFLMEGTSPNDLENVEPTNIKGNSKRTSKRRRK